MATHGKRSALEQLKEYYDHQELVCSECGFEDEEGTWEGQTNGGVVEYYHECPSCRATRGHTIDLSAG